MMARPCGVARLARPIRIVIVTPASRASRKGNYVTAARLAQLFRRLGHRARVTIEFRDQRCDMLIALHAVKSQASVERFRREFPNRPVVVVLTGTDVYGPKNPALFPSLKWASRIVVLQSHALQELPAGLRKKSRVIVQSAESTTHHPAPLRSCFEVTVVGHLRTVKDPFRAAYAARQLPSRSRIKILHLGGALTKAMADVASREQRFNTRYRWLGNVPRWRTLRLIARSRLLVVSSRSEGGPSVIAEACVADTPVIGSRIPGVTGLLGDNYPGLYSVGDTRALRDMLLMCEFDVGFYEHLQNWCRSRRNLFRPSRERALWRSLFHELQDELLAE